MKAILGICVIAIGILAAIFIGIVMLCYGLWDIIHNYETLTFGQFVVDVLFILGREVIAVFVAVGCYIAGIAIIKS
jgi:hypothetical protein